MTGYLKRSTITVLLLLLFIYIVIGGSGMAIQARLFTLAVGWIGIAIISVQLVRELLQQHHENKLMANGHQIEAENDGPEGAVDFVVTDEEKTAYGRMAAIEQFGWLWGMILCLWLIGFYISVPAMVGLYLRRHGESWLLSVLMTAGVWVTVWGLFHEMLNLPFPQGLLFRVIGG
ncbi:tripartite tricarboxylate transporter TctB family protein [Saccharospirillum sp.]|uniref:tripartite tricarboxylate transporter TctB family protein n=1 Tax=Saccharospirillum sp. TaxID=2033801 RepID=UPI0034A01DA7